MQKVACAFATTFMIAAAAATPAGAARYEVAACQLPDGTPAPADILTSSAFGASAFTTNECSSGRWLNAWLDAPVTHAPGERAEWTITAPQDTSLDTLTADRVATAGPATPEAEAVAELRTDKAILEHFKQYGAYPTYADGPIQFGLAGARSLTFGVACRGPNTCYAGYSQYKLRHVLLGVNDELAPTFVAAPAGPMMKADTRTAIRSLSYEARDKGSGLLNHRLWVDDEEQPAEPVPGNAPQCVRPFTTLTPCTGAVHPTFDVDTTSMTDGDHQIRLEIRDATDVNKAVYGPWPITVDNLPPDITGLTVTGTPRVGDTLSATALVAGQDASVAFQWLRADVDGGNLRPITGATGATYVLAPADEGHKILVRLTAGDGGGSASKTTSITDAPFDGGRTVVGYCSGRPTGKTEECGDFDGDGIVNRDDVDDDGDGVIDTDDAGPFDPKVPEVDPCKGEPTGPTDPCGDFDGDGQKNAADPDDDNDGIVDTADPNPFQGIGHTPERSTENGPVPGGLLAVNPRDPARLAALNPVAAPGPNGDPADDLAVLDARFQRGSGNAVRTTGRLVAAFAEKAHVRATITTQAGRPIRGARVFLAEKRPGAAEQSWKITGSSAVSDAQGRFKMTAAGRGHSRELRLVYFPQGGKDANRASNPLSLQVRQDASLSLSKRHLRNGQRLRFRGRVLGQVPMSGAAVQMQVKLASGWFTFKRLTAKRTAAGRFTTTYRFRRTRRKTTYRFRVRVAAGSTSYATGYSRTLRAVVRP
jgi:hypothetical protein